MEHKKYEYRTEEMWWYDDQEEEEELSFLNDLGQDGWEMVSKIESKTGSEANYIFKRAIINQQS